MYVEMSEILEKNHDRENGLGDSFVLVAGLSIFSHQRHTEDNLSGDQAKPDILINQSFFSTLKHLILWQSFSRF